MTMLREFDYQVRNPAGRRLAGRMRAPTEALARHELREQGYQVLAMDDLGEIRPGLGERLRMARPPSLQEKAVHTRQLAVMLNSGVPLIRALEVLGRQGANARLAQAWRDLQADVLRGSSLSRGMGRSSDIFGMLFVGLTRAGEISGALGGVLEHLAVLMEREVRLRARLRAAMTYPAFVFTVCMIVAFVLVNHVLPTFLNGVLRDMQLPWMTRLLVAVTDGLRNPYLVGLLLGGGAGAGFILQQHLKTPRGRYQLERFLLETPILREIQRRLIYARFCRTLATMLSSGATTVHSLEVASAAMSNFVLAEAVDSICTDLKDGCSLAESVDAAGFFPPMITRLVRVGEEAGDLVGILNRVADFYEEELDLALDSFTAALEPLLVALMGLFVGFVLIALFLPLYQLLTAL